MDVGAILFSLKIFTLMDVCLHANCLSYYSRSVFITIKAPCSAMLLIITEAKIMSYYHRQRNISLH